MMRDPFKKAQQVEIPDDSLLKKLITRVFSRLPPERRFMEKMLLLNNVSHPKNVIDATTDAKCSACGFDCWTAPSSKEHLKTATIICMQCLEKEAVVYGEEKMGAD
jgi:hypothetical protein